MAWDGETMPSKNVTNKTNYMNTNSCLIAIKMSKTNNITMKRSEKLISYAESIGVKDYFLIGEDMINPKRKLSTEPFEDLKGLINQNPNYDSILCQDHKILMRKPDFFNKLTRLLQEKKYKCIFQQLLIVFLMKDLLLAQPMQRLSIQLT